MHVVLSKYRLLVYFIFDYRYEPWKSQIGRPLVKTQIGIYGSPERKVKKKILVIQF